MKISTKKILLLQGGITFLLVLNYLFVGKNLNDYLIFLILLFGIIANYFLNGFADNKYPDKKKILTGVLVITILYQVIQFALWGLTVGFVRNIFSYNISFFIKLLIPIMLVIISSEILRHQMLTKGKSSKLIFVTTTLLFIIVDLCLNISTYNIGTAKGIFEIIMTLILPSLIKNMFLSYMSFNYGYDSPIAYRLILEVLIYFLPYYADIPLYLDTIIDIILPFILLLSLNYMVKNYKRNIVKHDIESSKKKTITNVISITIIAISVMFFILISGITKYNIIAVGSDSMNPIIFKGDAVVLKKVKDYSKIKEGNILIYKKNDKIVIHRVTEIRKDNKYSFITKGDSNKTNDNYVVFEEEVIGISLFKIKFVGYPTIWLNDVFGGK